MKRQLGAGTGLPGLLAAKLGARVCLTDLPVALPGLREHIAANAQPGVHIEARPLVWGSWDRDGLLALAGSLGRLDWILGADVFYAPAGRCLLAASL